MSHTDLFEKWIDVFAESCQAQAENSLSKKHRLVIVAMSRKMTRMLRLLQQKQLLRLDASVHVISEHAVCNELVSYAHLNGEETDVMIVDDAIYFGTTIDNIANAVYYITGKKPKVLSIVRNEVVTEIQNGILVSTDNAISMEWIPFVAQQISAWLVSTGYPMDFEFPIVHVDMSRVSVTPMQIQNHLSRIFLDSEVYCIQHDSDGNTKQANITILLDSKRRSLYSTCEFAKIRIFICQNQWVIETYSPQDIDEESIRFNRRMFVNNQLEAIWQNLLTHYAPVANKHQTDDLVQLQRMNDDYDYLRISSLVALANYLFSFYTLYAHWTGLQRLFECMGISPTYMLSTSDLQMIVGKEQAIQIGGVLQQILSQNILLSQPENQTFLFGGEKKVPSDNLKNKFEMLYYEAWAKAQKEEEALEMLFTYQRLFLSMDFSGTHREKSNRLRFGVSYAALIEDARLFLFHDEANLCIHRWMDWMIDLGVVAPKYLRISNASNTHWKRMFRCGENDSPLMQLIRICLQIIQTIASVVKSNQIEETDLKNLLSMVLFNPFHLWEDVICRFTIEKEEDAFSTRPVFQNGTVEIDLFDFMERYGFLEKRERNGVNCYNLSSSSIVKWFNLAIVFEESQYTQLHHYIRYIWDTSNQIPMLWRSSILKPSLELFAEEAKRMKKEFQNKVNEYLQSPNQDSQLANLLDEIEAQIYRLYSGYVQFQKRDSYPSDDNTEMELLFNDCFVHPDASYFQCEAFKQPMNTTEHLFLICSLGMSLLEGDLKTSRLMQVVLVPKNADADKVNLEAIRSTDYKSIAETLHNLLA